MGAILKITCFALLVFGSVQSSVLPVEKCTLTDKACMKPAVQKMVPIFLAGMPQYGIEVMDPLNMDDMKYDISGLQFSLTGGKLEGLKSAVIDDVEWDAANKVFTIVYHTDAVAKGPYTAGGVVGNLPISGVGDVTIDMKNIQVKFNVHFDVVKKGDKDYVKPTSYDFEFEVKDNASFDLTNLYNGDQKQSDNMLKFLNENWKQIFTDFGKPLVNACSSVLYRNVVLLFNTLSIPEIAKV